MRVFPLVALLVLAALLLPVAPAQVPAGPPNDDRANALPVPADAFALVQRTAGATLQPSEAAPCETVGATVWFSYQPISSGYESASTEGSSFDTVLTVYILTSFGILPIGCSDDAPGSLSGVTSEVRFRAVTGATYYIQAGGYAGSTGTLALRLTPATVPLAR